MTEPLEEKVMEMRAEGDLVDPGSFSLDPSRARQLMERYLHQDPRHYILHLVAVATLAAAEEVRVHRDSDDCILKFEGQFEQAPPLQELFAKALNQDCPIWFRELALAAIAALALEPRWVQLELHRKGETQITRLSGNQQTHETKPHEGADGLSFHLKEKLSLSAMMRSLGGVHPEENLLRQRCRFAPPRLLLNQMGLSRNWNGGRSLAVAFLGEATRSRREPAPEVILSKPDSELNGVVYLAKTDSRPSRFSVILNGVSFTDHQRCPEGAGAILYCSHLNKDLSQEALVEDEHYLEILARVESTLEELTRATIDQWEKLPKRLREARRDLLDDEAQAARSGNDEERVYRLKRVLEIQTQELGLMAAETQRLELDLVDTLLESEHRQEGVDFLLTLVQRAERHQLLERGVELARRLVDIGPESGRLLEGLEQLFLLYARSQNQSGCEQTYRQLEKLLESNPDGTERLRKLKSDHKQLWQKGEATRQQCERCGSPRLMPHGRLHGKEAALIDVVVGDKNPDALIFTRPIFAPLTGIVCGDCGHVELVVKNPRALWGEYRESKGLEAD